MSIEHEPWINTDVYCKQKEKICIVGESHYDKEGNDSVMLTHQVVQHAINGTKWMPFFLAIEYAFQRKSEMWNEVLFMNYLASVPTDGSEADKRDLIARSRERLLDMIAMHRPEKVFVFSRLAWRVFPNLVEEDEPRPNNIPFLIVEAAKSRSRHEWGHLRAKPKQGHEHIAKVYGLEHPSRYTSNIVEPLRASVQAAMQNLESKTRAWL